MHKHWLIFPITILLLVFNFQESHAQNPGIETAGDIGLIVVPVAALTITLIKSDGQGTWQFTKGFLLNQAVTYGLKVGINKPRPFNNGDNSFPSDHTSTTFQAASFIHRRYGFKYKF